MWKIIIDCVAICSVVYGQIAKPSGKNWPGKYNNGQNNRNRFGDWLLTGNWEGNLTYTYRDVEYEGYDGWYNNFARPDSGAIDRPLLRRWPAAYEDGTYLPSGSKRPNPLEISEKIFKHDIGTQSRVGKNALLVFFGQQVVEEILDAQRAACPPEYFNIPIPKDHPFRTGQPHHTELPVLRTRYDQRTGFSPNNPRQQLNEITPYLDGGLFYGITKQWADQLRTYEDGTIDENGCLASSYNGLFPEFNTDRLPMANPPPPFRHDMYIKEHETEKVKRFFKLGNPRGNENAFLLSFGVMWFRWHNYIAKLLKKHNPDWKSEQIYNEARKWVIATQQQVVLYEWLPKFVDLKKLPVYKEYDPSIDPQIDQFFQSAAFRFGHTLVTPGVYLRDYIRNGCGVKFNTWKQNAVRTCNIFWRPQDPILTNSTNNGTDPNDVIDIDRLLMGMASQFCEREDHVIVEDLRGNVFGPLEFPRRDLMAINIQRARDHGLPDFNTAREAFGLERVDFSHFDSPIVSNTTIQNLRELYNNSVDDIDVWVGGLLETRDGPGELFATIIIDQFRRIRDGDRFWFENKKNKLFTEEEFRRIKQIKLYDVLMAVTKMDDNDIQRDVFRVPSDNSTANVCNLTKRDCKTLNNTKINCYGLPALNAITLNESCVQGDSYDYFSNSEISFILSFSSVVAFIIGTFGVMFLLMCLKQRKLSQTSVISNNEIRRTFTDVQGLQCPLFVGDEWVSNRVPLRRIVIKIIKSMKQISVMDKTGEQLRALDFTNPNSKLDICRITDSPRVIIKCEHNYDLVMQYETEYLVQNVIAELQTFAKEINIPCHIVDSTLSAAMKLAVSKNVRQKRLDLFFRLVFAQAFKLEKSKRKFLQSTYNEARDAVKTELTIYEFADSLKMRPTDQFVKRMFYLLDKDKNGFISYREFLELIIIFAEGTEQKKAQLLFDMYDVEGRGYLTEEDFKTMIRSFLETVGGKVDDYDLQRTIAGMMATANVHHKKELRFTDFLDMVGSDIKNLSKAKLQFNVLNKEDRGSFLAEAKSTMEEIYESHAEIRARFQGSASRNETVSSVIDDTQEISINSNERPLKTNKNIVINYIERKYKEIFWLTLYTLVLLAIFAERAYYYSVEREHSGLRRIAGYGVTITRGAASAMMFTYSSLLVTMCRNTITFLRDSVANKYFPFNAIVEFHKYIAMWALFFTLMHIIGHAFNFYHISTQPADDLTCLFRNYFHATHELPKFHYWCWQTMTGFTGIVLTLIGAVMYIFAQSIVRRRIYNWFWYTHSLYPLFFIFLFLHGMGRLIQPPFFYYFALGPVILFTLDSLVSISRKKIEIPVLKAEILPSNVTMLEFKKPENFQYKSGQWVRIACLELNANEYHPFTLTSCPDEDTLTLHIRSVGPWTNNIRTIYDATLRTDNIYPKIYLDGPFGEGHQDWNLYDISILIGGGIGVTPFASILKDIVYKSSKAKCKKVYFIWVSRTQAQFEWLVNIIREVEEKDNLQILSCHIFITQFFEKFDLRTTLLYICERHYQRISGKSLFTNLRAVSHFGRPNFKHFFNTISSLHSSANSIGIFSCGPPSMTSSVDLACNEANLTSQQRFEHHFKNF